MLRRGFYAFYFKDQYSKVDSIQANKIEHLIWTVNNKRKSPSFIGFLDSSNQLCNPCQVQVYIYSEKDECFLLEKEFILLENIDPEQYKNYEEFNTAYYNEIRGKYEILVPCANCRYITTDYIFERDYKHLITENEDEYDEKEALCPKCNSQIIYDD